MALQVCLHVNLSEAQGTDRISLLAALSRRQNQLIANVGSSKTGNSEGSIKLSERTLKSNCWRTAFKNNNIEETMVFLIIIIIIIANRLFHGFERRQKTSLYFSFIYWIHFSSFGKQTATTINKITTTAVLIDATSGFSNCYITGLLN